jgi:PKHD-type hydroxylase
VVKLASQISPERIHQTWGKGDQYARDTHLHWLTPEDSNLWLFDRVVDAVKKINAEVFHFDLDGTFNRIQMGKYEVGQGYDWHWDLGANFPRRKLSLFIQLTDPSEYDGGAVEHFRTETSFVPASKKQGSLTVFPSWLLHHVTKVTRGERWSLATWLEGTPFR